MKSILLSSFFHSRRAITNFISDTGRKNYFFVAFLFFSSPFLWSQLYIGTTVYIEQGTELHNISPLTFFEQGIVQTSTAENYGVFSFAPKADWEGADLNSHIDGWVRTYSDDLFIFPTGNQRIIQPLLVNPISYEHPIAVNFKFEPFPSLEAEGSIAEVSTQFYWALKGRDSAHIALSWNIFSELAQLTQNNLNLLSIAGYDGNQWHIIESEIEETNFFNNSPSSHISGSIRTKDPIQLENYAALTLVRRTPTETVIKISQGFTPNGDGINDFWYIKNIEAHPNAHIQVYSRWERLVFESKNGYQNNWNGTFETNQNPLAEGSYAYLIDLEGDGIMDLNGWIYITR